MRETAPAESHFRKVTQLRVSLDSRQQTASPTPVACALIVPLVTNGIDTRNSHPSTAKQLRALPEMLPAPRFPHVASAGNYLYQQSARHFSRCSALNMALNLLASSQAKYMLWVKFVPGAVLGHSSRSACAVPIDRCWQKVPWQPVPVPPRSLPSLAKAGPSPRTRRCWNIQQ